MYRSLISTLSLSAAAFAATISIDVGEGGALKFTPNSVTAAVGDVLQFHFYSGSGGHSVVSGSFGSPCLPNSNSFFSGYIPGSTDGDSTFVVTVTSTDPIWFYCSLGHHCQAGMVGVVNPPAGQSISDFAAAAQSAASASAPPSLQGGVLTSISGEESSSTAATSTTVTVISTGSTASTTTGGSTTATAPPTTSNTSGSASPSKSSSSSAASTSAASTSAPAASTTPKPATASAGSATRISDKSTVLGLAIAVVGFVALMA